MSYIYFTFSLSFSLKNQLILSNLTGESLLYKAYHLSPNFHAPEKQRATILSVASFLRTLPYVVLAPVIGYLSTNGKLNYFLVIWPCLIYVAVFVYLGNKRTDDMIKLANEEQEKNIIRPAGIEPASRG